MEDHTTLRTCKQCKNSFPETEEYFPSSIVNGKRYLRYYCRDCWREKLRAKSGYYDHVEDRAKEEALKNGIRICAKCQLALPATTEFFHKYKRGSNGLNSLCKECRNREELKWRDDGYISQYGKMYYANNKLVVKARVKKYRTNNPEKNRAKVHLRRARKRNAEGKFTEAEVQRLYTDQGGKCFHCNTELGGDFHRDHWIPLSKGGSNWISNIRLLCPTCNLSKTNKLPREWCPERYSDHGYSLLT